MPATMAVDIQAQHLHQDDYPETVSLLRALFADHDPAPAGIEWSPTGAWISWRRLSRDMSTVRYRALVGLIHSVSVLEEERKRSGLQPHVAGAVMRAIEAVVW